MQPDEFRDLYDYNYWAHRQVWECLEQLSDEQITQDLEYSVGSLHDQCVHVMSVESWWFRFLRTGVVEFLNPDDHKTRASVRETWDVVEREVRDYLAALTPQELRREVSPDFWEGRLTVQVWQALVQVANHGTDHRAQMLAGIHRLGGPTVEQDYLSYLMARSGDGAQP